MEEIIAEIAACRVKRDAQGFKCNRYSDEHIPLYMVPSETARIILISESPSERASVRRALNNSNDPTFIDNVLPLIFGNSKVPGFELEKEFNQHFYWTHFCKCYPGSGGEKPNLNRICASNFLHREIERFKPILIVTIGNPASTFLFGLKRNASMRTLVNKINNLELNGRVIQTICLTHFSGSNRENKKKELKFTETRSLLRETLSSLGVNYISLD